MWRLKQNMMRFIWVIVCLASLAQAAPFAQKIQFEQPDGTRIELWGKGDEFYAVFETLDGYTVVFDPAAKAYYYAERSADGQQLLSTGLQVGKGDPRVGGLAQHVRITPEAVDKQVSSRFSRWELGMEVTRRWEASKLALSAAAEMTADGPIVMAPPSFATTGQKMGLCLLIDFDDDPATIPQAEIVNFCNGDNYTESGNNGSVKKYFLDNSKNLLVYSNAVTAYIRIPNSLHPKSWYNDTTKDCGGQANLLIRDALDIMKALPEYETEILPAFDALTVDGSGRAVACNVFYAGGNGNVWSYGLWPHSWGLYDVGEQELSPGGIKIFRYQATNIGSSLTIGTFCHENGHMLCGYPDLYDYGYDSVGGAGDFCLMGYGGGGGNPSQICAYLKRAAGWATTVDITAESVVVDAVLMSAQGSEGFNTFYRYAKPGTPQEYFLFENRQKAGRDASLPGSGIAIWHIDELGDKDNQSLVYNTTHKNYECTLMQADNQWHFQKDINSGDANDLYYQGNSAAGYQNVFSDLTGPSARWWDGSNSKLEAHGFSVSGPVMTFNVVPRPPVILSPAVLPAGRVGTTYSYAMIATGGAMPYTWQKTLGDLPAGLTLDSGGLISGMPDVDGTETFSIAVTGANGVAATNQFSLRIEPAFGSPYKETFENAGGAPDGWMQEYVDGDKSWQFRNGGEWGHPYLAYAGSYNAYLGVSSRTQCVTRLISPRIDFGASARGARLKFWHCMERWADGQDELYVYYKTDWTGEWIPLASYVTSVGAWTQRTLTLPDPGRSYYIAFEGKAKYGYGICIDDVELWDPTPPLGITTESPLPFATIDVPYTMTLAAEGGVEPYTYTYQIVSGGLPVGFDLTSDGVISGLSPTVQSSAFVVQVTDSGGTTAVKAFTLAVALPRADLFAEDFEDGGVMPDGWTQEFVTNAINWSLRSGGMNGHPVAAASGNYNAYLFSSAWVNGSAYNQKTRLVTPWIDLGQAPANVRLTFWHCMENWADGQDQLRVFYKASTNDAWTLLATYTSNVPSWTKRALALPNPTSTYRLAFEGNALFGYGVCVDDIRISDDADAPVITTGQALPNAVTAFPYSTTLSAVGGLSPYTWGVISNTLPAGLSLSTDGVISGTPTEQAWAYFRVRVEGADGKASTNLFSLRVINPGPMPFTETFEGGTLPFGWSQEKDSSAANWTFRSGSPVAENRTPASAYAGQYNACLFSPSSSYRVTKLITPMLNLGIGTTNARLTFWHCMAPYYGYQDELQVYYRATASDPWKTLTNFQSSVSTWTQRTVALPNPSPTYAIAFEGRARYGYGICIDNVSVMGDMLLTPYETWKQDVFGDDADNAAISGDEEDPDGDGIVNALEYAMGFNPLLPDTEGLPFGGVTAGYLTLSFRMDKEALDAGVTFAVEACTDLRVQDWTTAGVSEQMPRADSNAWWQAVFQHDVPVTNAPRRFMRFKVTLP